MCCKKLVWLLPVIIILATSCKKAKEEAKEATGEVIVAMTDDPSSKSKQVAKVYFKMQVELSKDGNEWVKVAAGSLYVEAGNPALTYFNKDNPTEIDTGAYKMLKLVIEKSTIVSTTALDLDLNITHDIVIDCSNTPISVPPADTITLVIDINTEKWWSDFGTLPDTNCWQNWANCFSVSVINE